MSWLDPWLARASRVRASVRRAVSILNLVLCTVAPFGAASAMGLGGATLNSVLGEPLRLSFPVSLQADEDVGCVQIRAKGDDVPTVLNTRSTVIRNAFQTRIEVTSAQPVNEPAIGIVVSVGCASPVAREYVVFLDPPVVPAVESLPRERAPVVAREPRVPLRAVPRRRATASESASAAASLDAAPLPQSPRPRRAPRTRPTPIAAETIPPKPASTKAAPPPTPTTVARGGDRLTVAPTEPVSTAPLPGGSAVPATTTSPLGSPPASSAGGGSNGVLAPTAQAGTASLPVADVTDREQALRQQQVDLQKQLKSLGDQIAALRVQTTTLASRNQVLENAALSPALVWMLIALAILAIVIAGWMTWRYTQLRRSMGDAAWWAGNSVLVPGGGSVPGGDPRATAASLDPGTRFGQRGATQTDARTSGTMASHTSAPSSVSSTASSSGSPLDRARAARDAAYPTAMDTDFTVSDIEAAMATVRTVSPPRDATRPKPLDDSDFAALGAPTQPAPYTEPPPPRARQVVERDGDNLGKFVDLDIPPLPVGRAPTPTPAASKVARRPASPAAPPPDEPEALDFKLDIPTGFDPLATDSLKTTVIDRANTMDFDLSPTPTALDFELPSPTAIEKADADATNGVGFERHGATALDDLFPALGPGPDTILDLDDRDASPLTTTEVDRLTATAVDAMDADSPSASTRVRLTRFADLMNQVDEAASSDPLRAIAHLRQYVLRDEQIPTLLWLRLFELYRTVDKKPVYDALSEHFARRYHRPMVGWNETLADRVPQTPLAAMGAIDREIESLWGKEEGIERLRQLLCDRNQENAVVFNAVLQRDLLDAAKVFPREQRA